MRYAYLPAGRNFWLDLALELRSYGHEPVLWYGDDRLLPEAKKVFGGCVFLEFSAFSSVESDGVASSLLREVFSSLDFHWMKDEAIKMMDRLDPHDYWSRKRREVEFYNALVVACGLIESTKPEFLLMSESPHDFFSYVFWRVCKCLKVPCIYFEAISLAPAIVMVSDDGDTPRRIPRSVRPESIVMGRVLADAEQRLRNVIDRSAEKALPPYMVQQAEKELRLKRPATKFREHILGLVPVMAFRGGGPYLGRSSRASGFGVRLASKRMRLLGMEKTDILKASYGSYSSSSIPDADFVYFPLHFEPERTTSPDGRVYYDQLRAIIEVRVRLPSSVLLVVKEHPSQLYRNMKGFRGRVVEFYELLNGIDGVLLVAESISSLDLIRRSSAVVTITGTAALEAAALGKPAFALGEAWFSDAPQVLKASELCRLDKVLSEGRGSFDEVLQWLRMHISKYAFFGCINPSNERGFKEYTAALEGQRAGNLARQVDAFLERHCGVGEA